MLPCAAVFPALPHVEPSCCWPDNWTLRGWDGRSSSEGEQLDQRRSDIEQRLNDVEDVCHANVQKATQAMQRDADTEGA